MRLNKIFYIIFFEIIKRSYNINAQYALAKGRNIRHYVVIIVTRERVRERLKRKPRLVNRIVPLVINERIPDNVQCTATTVRR